MSDLLAPPAWLPHALLHRHDAQPAFVRQGWDEAQSQDFGPWRLTPKPDPLAGQTVALDGPHEAVSSPPTADDLTSETASTPDGAETPSTGLSPSEVDHLLEEARREAWQLGHAQALQESQTSLQAERESLRALAQALHALQSHPLALLEPLKKLSIHVAQELVRGELRLDTSVIERLIHGCIEALDQPAHTTVVQVGHADMQRLRDLDLPGIALELDDGLSEGSVRAKVNDTQVQDLIEHRLALISSQIMDGGAG